LKTVPLRDHRSRQLPGGFLHLISTYHQGVEIWGANSETGQIDMVLAALPVRVVTQVVRRVADQRGFGEKGFSADLHMIIRH
jgi:hypothetical protein